MKITSARMPLVSILMPVCNAEKTLVKCLKSLISQTHSNIEIIAIDDFSRDRSYSILQGFRKKDKRLRVFRNVKRYGNAITLNRALKKAHGKFVAFVNPNDKYHPRKLERQLALLIEDEKTVAVGSQCFYTNQNKIKTGISGFPESSTDIYKKPLQGVSVQFETMLINKYRIPKDLLYFHSDDGVYLFSDVLVKLLQYGNVVNLPEALYFYGARDDKSSDQVKRQLPSVVRLWLRSEALSGHRPSFKLLFQDFLIKPKVSV